MHRCISPKKKSQQETVRDPDEEPSDHIPVTVRPDKWQEVEVKKGVHITIHPKADPRQAYAMYHFFHANTP